MSLPAAAPPAPPRSRRGLAPSKSPPAAPAGDGGPVRLGPPEVASPFAPGREVSFARVEGAWLASQGIRDGDHVALLRRDTAEHGDVAAVIGPDGRSALWKIRPESGGWWLSTGDGRHARFASAPPRVQGVVVGVLRRWSRP